MPTSSAGGNGPGPTTLPAPTPHPSALSPVADTATPPPIRRLAPLPTSVPHPVDAPNLDKIPIESTESSIRSTTRVLPKGIAKDALPVKTIDVPEYLLGGSMKKDRDDWRSRAIIELGNPNYKGVFATTREKDSEGKWRKAGLELHIYDTGEKNPPALPKGLHQEFLKEKVINPTRNMNQTIEEASASAENPYCNSAHQPAPPFHDSTTFSAIEGSPIEGSPSVAQSKQRASNRQISIPSSPFTSIAPPSKSTKVHLPRTVAPMRPPRSTIHLEEPVLPSADISTSTSHTPAPHIIKTEPEPEPVLAPTSDSPPERVLPQPSPRTTKLSEPTQSLLGIQFDSSFCSGSNAVESLSEIARGFLRRYVCAALPFGLLTVQRFFGYLESTEKARISGGYSEEALMSWQLNNLPSIGICPQVGNPQAQGHQITEVPRWFERNLLLRTSRILLYDAYLSVSTA